MARVQYTSEAYTFSSGGVAAGIPVQVVRAGTRIPAQLYSAEGAQLRNPLATDSAGQVSFWIEPGSYDLLANGVRTPFLIAGEPGEGGGSGGRLIHHQLTPSSLWNIPHALGFMPAVDVIRDDGVRVFSGVEHTGNTLVTLSFGDPTSGTAYLRA